MKDQQEQTSDQTERPAQLLERFESASEMRRIGDFAAALAQFEDLESKSTHPQDIAALQLFQCMCLTDMGRIDEADERISQIKKDHLIVVDQIDFESEYARIRRAQGQIGEALDRIEKAIKIAKTVGNKRQVEDAWSWMQALRGVLLAQSGKCDEATPILERIPIDDSWWAEARIHLGDCKVRKRLHREAIEIYLGLISSPKEIEPPLRLAAIRNAGCAYYYLGDYARAIEYLTQVECAYEDEPALKAELFGILASAYSRLGLTEEATKYAGFTSGSNSVQ